MRGASTTDPGGVPALPRCITLFSRILDLENHHPEQLLSLWDYARASRRQITAEGVEIFGDMTRDRTDTTSYVMRLGLANTFNPFMPDRSAAAAEKGGLPCYNLQLGINPGKNEERLICKLLAGLAAEEGQNWQNEW
jgi:hypothetical protein